MAIRERERERRNIDPALFKVLLAAIIENPIVPNNSNRLMKLPGYTTGDWQDAETNEAQIYSRS